MKVKSIIIATSLLVIGGLTSSFFISDVANALGELWFLSSNNVRPNVSTWGMQVPSLSNCNTIDTDSNGIFSCGTDSGGVSNWQFIGPNAVRPTTTVGIIINASSTISQVLNLDNYLLFTATSTPTTPTANHISVYAETTQGHTKLVFLDDDGLMFTMNRDNVFTAKNTSGSTINKGQAVYITGSTGNVPNVSPAQANSTSTLPAVGLATANISNNAFGEIMILGIISSIDTSAFATGDRVFVSPTTAGNLTNIRPNYSNFAQRMGSVMVSGVGNGSIYVTTAPFVGGEENWTVSSAGFTAKSLTISANGSATTTIASGISTFAGGLISQASSTFNGSITALGGFNGNASTADALFVNPTDCTNQFANAIAANGNLTCASVADAYVNFTALTLADFTNDGDYFKWANATSTYLSLTAWYSTTTADIAESGNLYYTDARVNTLLNATTSISINIEGNADTATALFANGSNCTTGNYPLGIDASGNVESCTVIPSADGSSNWQFIGQNALRPTSTIGIIVNASSTFSNLTATTTFAGGLTAGNNAAFVVNQAATANSLYVAANGNVGIGTATPSNILHVVGTDAALFQRDSANTIVLKSGGTNQTGILFQSNDSISNNTSFARFTSLVIDATDGSEKGGFAFITANPTLTEKMRIDNAGNVGIGTTTPAHPLVVNSAAASSLVVDSNGNVGIGTTAPGYKLDVAGTFRIAGNMDTNGYDITEVNSVRGRDAATFNINPNSLLTATTEQTLNIRTLNSASDAWVNAMTFSPSGANPSIYLLPTGTGNVGIGTTTPTSLLTLLSTGSLALPYGNPTVDNSGEIGINTDQASSSIRYYDGTAERVIFDVFEKSFWIASTTDDENNNSFDNATATFSLWNPARRFTLVGLYGKTDNGTVNFACGDNTNWTETIKADSDGEEDDGSMTNNTFTQREDFVCKIGSALSVPSKVTITIEARYDSD